MSETELSKTVKSKNWFGLDELVLSDANQKITIVVGSNTWTKPHLKKLRESAEIPGLTPIIDCDLTEDGKPYAVLPFLEGQTLEDFLHAKQDSWLELVSILETTARILHEAHQKELFHGALAPSQIHVVDKKVTIQGTGFGNGSQLSEEAKKWAAPETLSLTPPDERADVYSLGKILSLILSTLPDLDVPKSLARLVVWSSSETPEARPPSALEFASIIQESTGQTTVSYEPSLIPNTTFKELIKKSASSLPDSDISKQSEVLEEQAKPISFEDLAPAAALPDEVSTAKKEVASTSPLLENQPKEEGSRKFRVLATTAAALALLGLFLYETNTEEQTNPEVAQEQDEKSMLTGTTIETEEQQLSGPKKSSSETAKDQNTSTTLTPRGNNAISFEDTATPPIQVVHTIPDLSVDVYLDDELIANNFTSGQIAYPPVEEEYDLSFFTARNNPPTKATERIDTTLLTQQLKHETSTSVLAVFQLSENQEPLLSSEIQELTNLSPGSSKVVVHNFSSSEKLQIQVSDDQKNIANQSTFAIQPGTETMTVSQKDSSPFISKTFDANDGDIIHIFLYGSIDDNTLDASFSTFSGLSSPPSEIPSGNSGLKILSNA